MPRIGGQQAEKPIADNIVDKTTHFSGKPTGPPRQAPTILKADGWLGKEGAFPAKPPIRGADHRVIITGINKSQPHCPPNYSHSCFRKNPAFPAPSFQPFNKLINDEFAGSRQAHSTLG